MKVLIVTPSYFPIVGGAETLTRHLCTKLNEFGIRTDIMTLNMNKKWKPIWSEKIEQSDGFKVFKVAALNPFPFLAQNPFYYLLRLNVLPKLGFHKKFKNYDVIHFLGEADLSLPLFSYSTKKPKIMQFVSVPILGQQFRKHATMKKFFVRVLRSLADMCLINSIEDQGVLLDLHVPPDKIRLWHYGTDTNVFKPDASKKLDNLLLFVGRIERIKGLHVLLECLHLLNFRTQVVIIGPIWEPRYFEQIQKTINKINEEGVHTVKYIGSLNQHDLVSWYQRATIFVRPDVVGTSGAGMSTLEALACGTPVVGVQNHVVIDGINGRIVPRSNPAKLAEVIMDLLSDKKLLIKYGKEARKIIEKDYSLHTAINRLSNVYEELVYCKTVSSK